MSDEPITEADLQAYADGRLPEEPHKAVEAWLATRPEESERIAAYRRLAHEVRSAYETLLSEPVPPRLAHAASPPLLRSWSGTEAGGVEPGRLQAGASPWSEATYQGSVPAPAPMP